MKNKLERYKLRAAAFVQMRSATARLFCRFSNDESGSYLIIGGLLMPVLIGAVGLGTDYGLWVHMHQTAQSAADSAAVSAATDKKSTNINAQAKAVTSSYGFVHGANGATVTVNQPPKSGAFTTTFSAVEVIVNKSATPNFAGIFLAGPLTITARSVAIPKTGFGCILALNPTASSAISLKGSGSIQAPGCDVFANSSSASAIETCCGTEFKANAVYVVGGTNGGGITASEIKTGQQPLADPYASVEFPAHSTCTHTDYLVANNATLSPGVYCGGLNLQGNAIVTLSPGIYYINRGALSVSSNVTLQGTGVTIVLTSSTGANWATATFAAGSTLKLSAPTTGPLVGIALFGDRNMPAGTPVRMEGGSTQNLQGSIYVPKARLTFAGGSSTTVGCNQIIADTISFTGNGNLSVDCESVATKSVSSTTAKLVE